MVVLDATIVNIALPTAQNDLGFSDSDRQWIVTAYALAERQYEAPVLVQPSPRTVCERCAADRLGGQNRP